MIDIRNIDIRESRRRSGDGVRVSNERTASANEVIKFSTCQLARHTDGGTEKNTRRGVCVKERGDGRTSKRPATSDGT